MNMIANDDVIADLVAEYARLDAMLPRLTEPEWHTPSGALGWSVRDVVVHLATSEEAVAGSIAAVITAPAKWTDWNGALDDAMAAMVADDHAEPAQVLARWRAATAASLDALASADPDRAVAWAAAPLRPRTLATTRLAEHWAHGLDIAEPLGVAFADTDRLRHIAWLGHRSLPYAASLAGVAAQPVRAELVGPHGDVWVYGPADAASRIRGRAGAFCRVGARRLPAEESRLETEGPFATTALRILRNYAA